jgi:hypothetical protein
MFAFFNNISNSVIALLSEICQLYLVYNPVFILLFLDGNAETRSINCGFKNWLHTPLRKHRIGNEGDIQDHTTQYCPFKPAGDED